MNLGKTLSLKLSAVPVTGSVVKEGAAVVCCYVFRKSTFNCVYTLGLFSHLSSACIRAGVIYCSSCLIQQVALTKKNRPASF